MDLEIAAPAPSGAVRVVARAGLIAKGIIYILLGAIALMAALQIGGHSTKEADKTGVMVSIYDSAMGKWILPLLAIGLACYVLWRFIQAVRAGRSTPPDWKKTVVHTGSGLFYLAICISAFQLIMNQRGDNEDSQQKVASELLSKPFGEWLLGIAALIIAVIGIYQVYYGLSEKYKRHLQRLNLSGNSHKIVFTAGKIGYVARGVVWLIISYLMMRAALTASSSKAGDTDKAFQLVEHSPAGTYLLAIIAIGLAAYGFFNFIRARYETLQ